MVSPCLLTAIRTISGKLGSDVCLKEVRKANEKTVLYCGHDYLLSADLQLVYHGDRG